MVKICYKTLNLIFFIKISNLYRYIKLYLTMHIVPCGKFHRIEGVPPETFSSEKYDAPEAVGGDRKCFDSPNRK